MAGCDSRLPVFLGHGLHLLHCMGRRKDTAGGKLKTHIKAKMRLGESNTKDSLRRHMFFTPAFLSVGGGEADDHIFN